MSRFNESKHCKQAALFLKYLDDYIAEAVFMGWPAGHWYMVF
jgi:hypothetical protein